jgi:NAD(P)-dependent dehydrogenase (short-subunit alcohol dehydrogenase family)
MTDGADRDRPAGAPVPPSAARRHPTGRTVVVTGGLRGIGEGVVRRLVGAGWRCGVIDVDAAGSDDAAAIGAALACADVADPAALEEAFRTLRAELGELDGLVNCAGINLTGAAVELSVDDWRRVLDVDLSGTFYACRAAAPHLRPGSAVVNVASVLAIRARRGRIAYAAAKAGVVAVTRVLAVEWAERSIRVNAVAPGWTDTPLIRGQVAAGTLDLELLDAVPMGRLATVEEVAGAVEFLLGDDAGFITGHTLLVDGGYTWAG